MSTYIISLSDTEEVVRIGSIDPPLADNQLRQGAADALGGSPEDYMTYFAATETESDRLLAGHDFTLIIDSGPPKTISGVDFSSQDNKPYLKFTSDKDVLMANGTDTFTITIEVLDPDTQDIRTDINTTRIINITTPVGPTDIQITVTDGVATFTVLPKIDEYGEWEFPTDGTNSMISGLRVKQSAVVSAGRVFP